jgi:hypothetical protein
VIEQDVGLVVDGEKRWLFKTVELFSLARLVATESIWMLV